MRVLSSSPIVLTEDPAGSPTRRRAQTGARYSSRVRPSLGGPLPAIHDWARRHPEFMGEEKQEKA